MNKPSVQFVLSTKSAKQKDSVPVFSVCSILFFSLVFTAIIWSSERDAEEREREQRTLDMSTVTMPFNRYFPTIYTQTHTLYSAYTLVWYGIGCKPFDSFKCVHYSVFTGFDSIIVFLHPVYKIEHKCCRAKCNLKFN